MTKSTYSLELRNKQKSQCEDIRCPKHCDNFRTSDGLKFNFVIQGYRLALATTLIAVSGFLFIGNVFAQELPDSGMPKVPGAISGTSTHFEITDSQYLNLTLDSSEEITTNIESVPEMITMVFELSPTATSTQITVSGFQPNITYYKYEDNYHNLTVFTTDSSGSYSYTQDISQPHFVFIQPRASTKFIKDDVAGGDCASIGIWNQLTKTCTLTQDVLETIQIDNSYVTLDGNGYSLTSSGTGFGGFNKEYLPAQDLPLTPCYWLSFIVEKIRKAKRHL